LNGLCPACRTRLPAFDYAWSALRYTGAVKDIIHRFKFHDRTSLRHTAATLFRIFFDRYGIPPRADMIIPMPLHPVRLRERGYNQALLLAGTLSTLWNIPCRPDILARIRLSRPQSELGQKERWTNISNAFRIETSSGIKGAHILLVDDLLTTGATADEAARALKNAGAARIGLITLAAT
jgi:ComF family protein